MQCYCGQHNIFSDSMAKSAHDVFTNTFAKSFAHNVFLNSTTNSLARYISERHGVSDNVSIRSLYFKLVGIVGIIRAMWRFSRDTDDLCVFVDASSGEGTKGSACSVGEAVQTAGEKPGCGSAEIM